VAANCSSLTVSGVPSNVPSPTGQYRFSISAPSNCAWTARTDTGWADIAPGSGNGDATATLNVNENELFSPRTFTVTVNTQSFQVTQYTPGCSYNVDPASLDESGSGGVARVTIATGSNCGWTATASEGWLRVNNTGGTGAAVVLIDVAPNPGDVRHAYLTVAGRHINVTQRRR
jgi:hypothetical protein